MLKYVDTEVVFRELPDEITLAINISNCPCNCPGCHSSYLSQDIGIPLTIESLENLIEKNPGISAICFMGGDSNPKEISKLAKYLKEDSKHYLAVGWYSGRQELSNEIDLEYFNFIKLGPYIESLGGLDKETTNQKMYLVSPGQELIDITERLRNNINKF